jgi:hypothetical protein
VTGAATCTTSGAGLARPRATQQRQLPGVARWTRRPILRLARIKQRRPTGQTLPEGALGWLATTRPGGDPIAMPTDHGADLAELRKRLADAKEFL